MIEIQKTGGARIGRSNATWPFATLTVNKDYLELNAGLIGNLIFRASDIISIQPYSMPFGIGLKITHTVKNYKELVVFSTLDNNYELLREIEQIGLHKSTNQIALANESKIALFQEQGAFPLKKSAAIVTILIWNIAILYDFIPFLLSNKNGPVFGVGVMIALGFVLFTSISLLISEPVRHLMLKEGRTINHINRFLFFLMLICSVLFCATILMQ